MAEKQPKWVRFVIRLTEAERSDLQRMVDEGKRAGSVLKHAWVLLKADANGIGVSTVHRVRQAFVEEGLDVALYRKKPTGRQYRKLDGAQEAKLLAIACSQPPAGRKRWTLQLLADRLVQLKVVDSISYECVRNTLKKTSSSRT